MAQLSIQPIMSIVRNTVLLRNATLGALVVLALLECNGFVIAITVILLCGIVGLL